MLVVYRPMKVSLLRVGNGTLRNPVRNGFIDQEYITVGRFWIKVIPCIIVTYFCLYNERPLESICTQQAIPALFSWQVSTWFIRVHLI